MAMKKNSKMKEDLKKSLNEMAIEELQRKVEETN